MSQKVKEIKCRIDGWKQGFLLLKLDGIEPCDLPLDGKCTLLVPVEEKKVTISESEFDEIVKEITCTNHVNSELLKQKLFSGNGG